MTLEIGNKTAEILVVLTDGFDRFASKSELCRTNTHNWKKGSSVNGRSRISKIGNQKLHDLAFMCSFNACKPIGRLVKQGL